MFDPMTSETTSDASSTDTASNAAESYERGLALRKASLFKQAIDQFAQAATAPTYTLKAHAQIGLCWKSMGQYEQAVTAFRNALKTCTASKKETVQILYVLGRTLESLERANEALEAYRWLRREDPHYRDVTDRIEALVTRKGQTVYSSAQRGAIRASEWHRPWHGLLRNMK